MSEDQDDRPISPSLSSGQPSQAGEAPSPDTPTDGGVSPASPERLDSASGETPPAQLGNSKPGGTTSLEPTSPGIPQKLTGGGPPLYATGGGQPIRPLSGAPWSVEDDNVLRRRWHERGGAAAIGRELGRTRNAVIGRANRLGLSVPRGLTEARRKAGAEAAERRRQAKRVAAARKRALGKPHPKDDHPWRAPWAVSMTGGTEPPVPAPERADGTPPDACELMDFTNWTCRFPLGKLDDPVKWFCGVPEADMMAGVAYCREHSALCYAEPAPRRR